MLFSSLILHRFFNKVFEMPIGYKKGKIRIPAIIKEASLSIKKYFVIGFFDGDGYCNKTFLRRNFTPVVSVSQASRKMLEDIKEILLEGGVHMNLIKRTRANHIWYELNTKDRQQIRNFRKSFGFRYRTKSQNLNLLVEKISFKEAKLKDL